MLFLHNDPVPIIALEKYLTIEIINEDTLDITKECARKLVYKPDWVYAIHVEDMVNVKRVSLKYIKDNDDQNGQEVFTADVTDKIKVIGIPLAFNEDIPSNMFIDFSGTKEMSVIPSIDCFDSIRDWTILLDPLDVTQHAQANVKLSVGYLSPWTNLRRNVFCTTRYGIPVYYVNGKKFTATLRESNSMEASLPSKKNYEVATKQYKNKSCAIM
jgi:hypothetical protein